MLPNIDDSPSKDWLLQHGFADETRSRGLLFDLYLDPVERENRVSDSWYQTVYEQFSTCLGR